VEPQKTQSSQRIGPIPGPGLLFPDSRFAILASCTISEMANARFRMPAEWEPQSCVWVSPPHNAETWPGCLDEAQEQFEALTAAMAEVVEVRAIESLGHTTNDSWIRDYGPIFVEDADGKVHAHDFGFNSYGEKFPPYDRDDATPQRIAGALGMPVTSHAEILEGGSIEPNGRGVLLTTQQCLLAETRNPALSRTALEQKLSEWLGVERVVWLNLGLVGDDTDGHIDNIARFIAPGTVAIVSPTPDHPDFDRMQQNRGILEAETDFTLIDLPTADTVFYDFPECRPYESGRMRLPASYANFLISNGSVFVPTFGVPSDDNALRVLDDAMPEHTIVGVRSEFLLVGMGGIHCLTCHQPAGGS